MKQYKQPRLLPDMRSWFRTSAFLSSLCSPACVLDHAHVSSPISTELILQSRSCQSWTTGDASSGDAALERKDRNYSGPRKYYFISECKDGIIQKQPAEICLLLGCGVKRFRSGKMSYNKDILCLFLQHWNFLSFVMATTVSKQLIIATTRL